MSLSRAVLPLVLAVVTGFCWFGGASSAAWGQDFGQFGNFGGRYLPPGLRPPRYRLGVAVRNLETGVQITQVAPNSPAAAFGLEPGDIILTVSGHQVGYIGQRLVDLEDEINGRVDQDVRVRLLLLNRRNGQLVNADVALDGRGPDNGGGGGDGGPQRVRGRIVARQQLPIPREALTYIRLLDATRQDQPQRINEQVVRGPGQIPMNFEFDVGQLSRRRRYAYEVQVTLGNQIVYRTPTPVLCPGFGPPPYMELEVQVEGNFGVIGPRGGGSQPLDQIRGWYGQYLNREPTAREMQVWQAHLARGRSLDEVRNYLLAGNEFYDNSGHDDGQFVAKAHQQLHGRAPNNAEQQRLLQELQKNPAQRSAFIGKMAQAKGN